jgi:2-dehydro-3-deoxyphosphooctonate aldolase (KDO 8-P synthase)
MTYSNKIVTLSGSNSSLQIANHLPFTLISGPCVLESKDHAFQMAGALKELTQKYNIPFIYKTSFDKANRTSIKGARGLGLEKSLAIFKDLKQQLGVPVLTDVHEPHQCAEISEAVDVLQIPAFLCRQTDLLIAAGQTGKIINVKKGQFLAPWDMSNVVKKIEETGNTNILLCERGASFGYNNLVVDMRSLPLMAQTGYPVIMDATHAVQQPGGMGTATGGDRRMIPVMARAALSIGVAGVFMECHDNPDVAPSDGPNMIKLSDMPEMLETMLEFDQVSKKRPLKIA